MIRLTRLNGSEVVLNADLIEFVETTPDTLVTLVTGKKIPVRETTEEVIQRVVSYRRATGAAGAADLFGRMQRASAKENKDA
jgi:flagellar protein FlbD